VTTEARVLDLEERGEMAQANGIVLRIRTDKADEFERLFAAEELPL
jgi:hypothetical protein